MRAGLTTKAKQFDSSVGGEPFTFRLGAGDVIRGWDQGFEGMRVRRQAAADHPARSRLRRNGHAGRAIPGNAGLVFDMELAETCSIARSDRLRCYGRAAFQQHAVVALIEPCAPTVPYCMRRRSARTGPRAAAAGVSRVGVRPIAFACPARMTRYLNEPKSPVASDASRPRRIRWLDGVARYAAVDASPLSSSCLKRRRSSAI